jgi:ribose-phosphate pyrophosphokinase
MPRSGGLLEAILESLDQGDIGGSRPRFFALSESADFARRVCEEARLPLSPLEEHRFEGGEFKFRPLESVRGRTVVVLQSLAGTEALPVGERLTRLLFLLLGLRDAGADRRVVLLPYLTFAREDRRTQLRDPVTSRYVAELLEAAGASQLVTLDVHNPAALDNAFRIPVDHLSAVPMLVDHLATRFGREDLTVVSPDIGGIKRVQLFREHLIARLGRAVGIAFIEKRRQNDKLSGGTLVGDVAGQTVLILDDLCATGETLARAAKACHQAGAAAIHVAVTHTPVPAGIDSVEALDCIAGVVVTDSTGFNTASLGTTSTIPGKRTILAVAPLFGQATRRLLARKPLSPLLERWPVSFEE